MSNIFNIKCIYFENELFQKFNTTFILNPEGFVKLMNVHSVVNFQGLYKRHSLIATMHVLQMRTLHLISTSRVCVLRSFSWMACHMTPLPLFGSASPCNQRLLKSYKTEPEVETRGRAASGPVFERQIQRKWDRQRQTGHNILQKMTRIVFSCLTSWIMNDK